MLQFQHWDRHKFITACGFFTINYALLFSVITFLYCCFLFMNTNLLDGSRNFLPDDGSVAAATRRGLQWRVNILNLYYFVQNKMSFHRIVLAVSFNSIYIKNILKGPFFYMPSTLRRQ